MRAWDRYVNAEPAPDLKLHKAEHKTKPAYERECDDRPQPARRRARPRVAALVATACLLVAMIAIPAL